CGVRPGARVRGERAQGRRAAPGDRARRRVERRPGDGDRPTGCRRRGGSGLGPHARRTGSCDRGSPMILVIDNYDSFTFNLVQAPTPVHGEASSVGQDGGGLLAGLPAPFEGARYHSLCVDPATLPPELYVTATSPVDGVVMGLRHATLPLEGVQFHPESVLTPQGPHLLANFLRQAGEGEASRLDAVSGSFATAGMAESDAAAAPAGLVR